MENIKIHYRFNMDNRQSEEFDILLDGQTLLLIDEPSPDSKGSTLEYPDWTKLNFHKCSNCPLSEETHPHCPAAVSVSRVIERFDNVFSYDELDLEVIRGARHLSQHTTAQRAISSLLGLLFATSGCPHTDFLKPMARFHLPLASEEETIFRAAGMYLLAQFYLQKDGKHGALELIGLTTIYENLHLINKMIAERIRSVAHSDSSVNAVVLLDMFTNLMPFVIEEHMDEIRHLFEAYL
ncbi:MAG: hypothetical protein OQK78_11435 [Gammaproteobacteria bacterium]|nr:hypothetical protein [Gammaproteobacteria bacterium]